MTSRFVELGLLIERDVQLRKELVARKELFGGYHPQMEVLQTANGNALEALIEQFGWPDPEIDGQEVCRNAWYIVMHAISLPRLQRNVLSLLKSKQCGCTQTQLAMLEDRILVFSGKKQKFGTQLDWDSSGNLNPFPIEDFARVEKRRSEIGLPTLQESIAALRERAIAEGDQPPLNFAEHTKKREEWMLQVGWVNHKSEIDPAYSAV